MTLTPACCKKVRDRLARYPWRKEAAAFWNDNEAAIMELPPLIRDSFVAALRKRDKPEALLALLLVSTKQEWLGERAATLAYLEALRDRREAMAKALTQLGEWALRVLGRVLGAVL